MLFMGSAFAQVDYTHKNTSDLTVTIKNINKFKGVIMVGLYNSDSTWLQMGKEYRGAEVEITATTVTYVFKDLPFGTYGLSVFHDKNTDGECNKNWVGMPTEGYCFSNNFKPLVGAPKYKDTSFKFSKQMTLYLNMIY
jgi:uncharacterized protein (DUF2141 family)